MKQILKKYKEKINPSIRHTDYRKYYNKRTFGLVEKYEKFVINEHNYKFDSI
jgi:hypothetical protein